RRRQVARILAELEGQSYFAPLVTNTSATAITIEVNPGTRAAARCNCVVPKGGVRTHVGYYRLYRNSVVAAYNNAHPYVGPHADREGFAARVAPRWVKWMEMDGRGIGVLTQRALRLIARGAEPFDAGRSARGADPRGAASNGAVMRCIPVALRYHDNVDRLIRVSTQQAAITHADERCTWGAVAVNLAGRELLNGNPYFVEEVLHRLQGTAPRALIEAIRRVPWE